MRPPTSTFAAGTRLLWALFQHGWLLLCGSPIKRPPPAGSRGLYALVVGLNTAALAVGSTLRTQPETLTQLVVTVPWSLLFFLAISRLSEYVCHYMTGSDELHTQANWLLMLTLLPAITIETLLATIGFAASPLVSALALTRFPQQVRALQDINRH